MGNLFRGKKLIAFTIKYITISYYIICRTEPCKHLLLNSYGFKIHNIDEIQIDENHDSLGSLLYSNICIILIIQVE